jgi:hypothetical protein
MKTIRPVLVIALLIFISTNAFSQFMPPAPVKVSIFESISGNWISEPYEIMGSKRTEVVTQNYVLNGQFYQVYVKSISEGFEYESIIMIAPEENGTLTGWSYDVFGKNAIKTYTGTWNEKQIYVEGINNRGSDSRLITLEGNVMVQNVTFKMKDEDGDDLPGLAFTVTYNKK